MKKNVGSADAYLRFMIGFAFIMNIFVLNPGAVGIIILLVLGIGMMFTAFAGYCWLYDLIKVDTCKKTCVADVKAESAGH